jgi:hypothetical protein
LRRRERDESAHDLSKVEAVDKQVRGYRDISSHQLFIRHDMAVAADAVDNLARHDHDRKSCLENGLTVPRKVSPGVGNQT